MDVARALAKVGSHPDSPGHTFELFHDEVYKLGDLVEVSHHQSLIMSNWWVMMSDNIISTCTIANGQTCLHSIELDIEYRESLDEKTSTLTSFYGTVSHVTNLTVFFYFRFSFGRVGCGRGWFVNFTKNSPKNAQASFSKDSLAQIYVRASQIHGKVWLIIPYDVIISICSIPLKKITWNGINQFGLIGLTRISSIYKIWVINQVSRYESYRSHNPDESSYLGTRIQRTRNCPETSFVDNSWNLCRLLCKYDYVWVIN